MTPVILENRTRRLAEDQPQYQPLDIIDTVSVEDQESPVMVSFWKPSEEELKALMAGNAVRLSIMGTIHPPVLVDVMV